MVEYDHNFAVAIMIHLKVYVYIVYGITLHRQWVACTIHCLNFVISNIILEPAKDTYSLWKRSLNA